jgi:hypothetical protein
MGQPQARPTKPNGWSSREEASSPPNPSSSLLRGGLCSGCSTSGGESGQDERAHTFGLLIVGADPREAVDAAKVRLRAGWVDLDLTCLGGCFDGTARPGS